MAKHQKREMIAFFWKLTGHETSGHPRNKLMYPIIDYLVKDRLILSE